jgi:starch-binding outer membrane protein, SusD/RagB family
VLLNKAEALARLNRLAEAVTEYNKIRVRAGLLPHVLGTDVTTQAQVLDAIWTQRRLELALEGDRFPDLVRTGQAMTVLALPSNRSFQLLYPVPSRELIVAPGLTQNPGY